MTEWIKGPYEFVESIGCYRNPEGRLFLPHDSPIPSGYWRMRSFQIGYGPKWPESIAAWEIKKGPPAANQGPPTEERGRP